jgi:hypothetical protein
VGPPAARARHDVGTPRPLLHISVAHWYLHPAPPRPAPPRSKLFKISQTSFKISSNLFGGAVSSSESPATPPISALASSIARAAASCSKCSLRARTAARIRDRKACMTLCLLSKVLPPSLVAFCYCYFTICLSGAIQLLVAVLGPMSRSELFSFLSVPALLS